MPNTTHATHRTTCRDSQFVLEELTGGDSSVPGLTDPSTGGVPESFSHSGSRPGLALPSSSAPPLNKNQLPEVLAGTLDHIVGQLDMVTRTLAILDKRLSLQEDMMAQQMSGKAEEQVGRIEREGGTE